MLANMRHVMQHPKSEDTTEGQRDCRKWKESDVKGFYSRLSALEEADYKAQEEAARKREPEKRVEKDVDLERCMEVAQEWLENEAQRREEGR